jgi:hypothetical protein
VELEDKLRLYRCLDTINWITSASNWHQRWCEFLELTIWPPDNFALNSSLSLMSTSGVNLVRAKMLDLYTKVSKNTVGALFITYQGHERALCQLRWRKDIGWWVEGELDVAGTRGESQILSREESGTCEGQTMSTSRIRGIARFWLSRNRWFQTRI